MSKPVDTSAARVESCAMRLESGAWPYPGLAAAALIRALATERDALRAALGECEAWVTAALECKDWSWDQDQHEAATSSRDTARALLEGKTP